jgi:hypothetical protein
MATGENITSQKLTISFLIKSGLNAIHTGCCIHAFADNIHIADKLVHIAVAQVTLKCAFFESFHHPQNITAIITDSKKKAIIHSIAKGAQKISHTNQE